MYLWRSGEVPEISNICGEVEKARIPPGIFPPTWRSSAPLSAASRFWPTNEKLRNENLVQNSGLALRLICLILLVSSSPLFIGPESDNCLPLSLTLVNWVTFWRLRWSDCSWLVKMIPYEFLLLLLFLKLVLRKCLWWLRVYLAAAWQQSVDT